MTCLREVVLDLEADCATFCHLVGHQDILAVGTYHIDESTQQRCGRLHVYTLEETGQLQSLSSLDAAAIFDMRWLEPGGCDPQLALATAAGSLQILSCKGVECETIANHDVFEDALSTSVAQSTRSSDQDELELFLSSSSGEIAEIQIAEAGPRTQRKWVAHDLEAWNCCTDKWQKHILYSGGDDCAFKGWDLRQSERQPIFTNRKSHMAGVCCIASSPHEDQVLVTGSYDERIRVWDTRKMTLPTEEVKTGGGVWRLKWHPHRKELLLASCMHNGFQILCRVGSTMQVQHHYTHQRSLAYDADWCHHPQMPLIASVSFYDRLLHIWRPPIECSPDHPTE